LLEDIVMQCDVFSALPCIDLNSENLALTGKRI